MQTVKVGKTNLKVSRIGLGTLAFGHPTKGIQDKKEIYDCLNFALDNGINFIDTAEEYSHGLTEKFIGEVIKKRGDREDPAYLRQLNLLPESCTRSAQAVEEAPWQGRR